MATALVTTIVSTAQAQGPAPSAAPADAGAPESTIGCVETVPEGGAKPLVFDNFPTRATSGWATTLAITVRHGKGERVLPSGLDLSGAVEAKKVLKQAGFAIPEQDGGAGARLWQEPDDPKASGATTHLEIPLVPLPANAGRNLMTLPPMPVAVARANGKVATVCTHPHQIVVDDPIANTPEAQPKSNPPAIPQREEWTTLKRAVMWSAIGIAIGALLAYLVYKRMTAPKPPPPPEPPRPPWEIALEALDDLRHAGLLEERRYMEHFDRTSDAVRRYLGARFGFDGLESTTDEILVALRTQAGGYVRLETGDETKGPAPGIAIERVARFLRDCDLVKFANLTPTPEQCATSIEKGEEIVRLTMPVMHPRDRDRPSRPASSSRDVGAAP
jgi:hypothetical protein